jgi:hypothetical protein
MGAQLELRADRNKADRVNYSGHTMTNIKAYALDKFAQGGALEKGPVK